MAVQVLFGGILGSLYSGLQFLMSPFWGSLSDRWGRRKVMLVSTAGILASHLLWFFSGTFLLLLIARILGGVLGGTLSSATAAMADRDMAFIVPAVDGCLGLEQGLPGLALVQVLVHHLDHAPASGGCRFLFY